LLATEDAGEALLLFGDGDLCWCLDLLEDDLFENDGTVGIGGGGGGANPAANAAANGFELLPNGKYMKYSIIHCDNIDLQNRFVTMMIKKEGLADRIYNQ